MGIGTSLGAHFETDLDHEAGNQTVIKPKDTGDDNVLPPDEGSYDKKDGVINVSYDVPHSDYDTKLSKEDEAKFSQWKVENAPKDSGFDYDLRGAFKAGVKPDQETGHWPDTFKKPNHPTFSDQSQYAKDRPDLAGKWDGDNYIPPEVEPHQLTGREASLFYDATNSGQPSIADWFLGTNGHERHQLWPERMIRGIVNSAHEVGAGQVPGWTMDPTTGEFHTSIDMMEHAWDLMPAVLSGTIPTRVNINQVAKQETSLGLKGSSSGPEWEALHNRVIDGSATEAEVNQWVSSHERAGANATVIREALQDLRNYQIGSPTAREAVNEHVASMRRTSNPAVDAFMEDYRAATATREAELRATHPSLNRQEPADSLANRRRLANSDWWNDTHTTVESVIREYYNPFVSKGLGSKEIKQGNITVKNLRNSGYSGTNHTFEFADEAGKGGTLNISESDGGRELYVNFVGGDYARNPNVLGPSKTRDLLRAIEKEFPEARAIAGFRVSGARGAARRPNSARIKINKKKPTEEAAE